MQIGVHETEVKQKPQLDTLIWPECMKLRFFCAGLLAQIHHSINIVCREIICIIYNPDVQVYDGTSCDAVFGSFKQVNRIVAFSVYVQCDPVVKMQICELSS